MQRIDEKEAQFVTDTLRQIEDRLAQRGRSDLAQTLRKVIKGLQEEGGVEVTKKLQS